MRRRIDERCVNGKYWIEEMGETDTPGFGDKADAAHGYIGPEIFELHLKIIFHRSPAVSQASESIL